MYRNTGLVLATAAAFLLLAEPARAQVASAPTFSGPSAGIPTRLIATSPALVLRPEQVRSLKALSSQLDREATLLRLSSKPWITAARLTSPSEAYARALALLDAGQRSHAARLLERRGGAE
jgi:hypothetical protein